MQSRCSTFADITVVVVTEKPAVAPTAEKKERKKKKKKSHATAQQTSEAPHLVDVDVKVGEKSVDDCGESLPGSHVERRGTVGGACVDFDARRG